MIPAAGEVLWTPSPEQVERANLTAFARWLQRERGVRAVTYADLHRWSVEDLDDFWRSIWEYFDVAADGEAEPVLADRSMPGAQWFPSARLNYAEHVLRGRDDAEVALRHGSERSAVAAMTWGELRDAVARVATGLRRLGVGPGDVVAAYLPNVPETLAAFLACASIGAIWTCAAPEFGADAVADRFAQIAPKVLLAVDGYRFGGRDYDRRPVVAELARRIGSVERVVVLDVLGSGAIDGTIEWGTLIAEREELAFMRLPFDHPLWVLYSSGTTGLPKAIVHGHGGMLLEQLKSHHLHMDARPGDRVFVYTTTTWMMWNLLVGVLLTPASIVLYDGSPVVGAPDRLWAIAEEAGATILTVSAGYLAVCAKRGVDPHAGGRRLAGLHTLNSTGSPLAPESYRWVYDHVGPDVRLTSGSGGTDVCTGFVGSVPTLPVHAGEMQGAQLGVDVRAFDEWGRAVVDEIGELVIVQPMPSMPLRFWGDEDGARMREAYFAMYPGVWRHGDWLVLTARGTAIISGRSDATINRGGVRMGTSEIYRALLGDDAVLDALVVDVPRAGTEGWMPLFVTLREGEELDDELVARLKRRIREGCSPRHVPDEVVAVPELPRTLTGKTLEVPVKRILMGRDPRDVVASGALANPGALEPLVAYARDLVARAGAPSGGSP